MDVARPNKKEFENLRMMQECWVVLILPTLLIRKLKIKYFAIQFYINLFSQIRIN
jgi:hypothetical protein